MKTEINEKTDSITITRDDWFRIGEELGVERFLLNFIANDFPDDAPETFVYVPENILSGDES